MDRKLRSYRLPEFVLSGPAQLAGAGEEHVDRHADKRVLRDPLALSPALAVERPAYPRQLVQLVRRSRSSLRSRCCHFGVCDSVTSAVPGRRTRGLACTGAAAAGGAVDGGTVSGLAGKVTGSAGKAAASAARASAMLTALWFDIS